MSRAQVRDYVVGRVASFDPPPGFVPALTWHQDPRSAWWMDRPGFSPQAGGWGVRMPSQVPLGERNQSVQGIDAEIVVPIHISPTVGRAAEDAALDELVDALHAHVFESTEVGEALIHVGTTLTALIDGWIIVILRLRAIALLEP